MKHYLVLCYGIHSAAEGFISCQQIWRSKKGKLFTESMWKLLFNWSLLNEENRLWKDERKVCFLRWGSGADSFSSGHICAVSKCAFCKLGMLMFRLRQLQAYRPQTTPVWSGAWSQSVTGWQMTVRGATVPPGKTQYKQILWDSGFITIVRKKNNVAILLALKHWCQTIYCVNGSLQSPQHWAYFVLLEPETHENVSLRRE